MRKLRKTRRLLGACRTSAASVPSIVAGAKAEQFCERYEQVRARIRREMRAIAFYPCSSRSSCRAACRHSRNRPGFLKALQTKRSPTGVPPVWRVKELAEQLPSERYPAGRRVRC